MSKKTTKQLKEILISQQEYWSQNSERIMDKINQVETPKFIVFADYVADEIPMVYSYCQKCGKEERFPSADFQKYDQACTCGIKTYKRWVPSPEVLSMDEFLVPTKVTDDYFCFVFCRAGLLACAEKTSMEQMKEPLKWVWIDFCTYGIFSKDVGVLFVDSKGNCIRRGGSAYQKLLNGIDRATKIDQDSIQHLLPSGKRIVEIQSQQNQKKKAPSAKEIPIPDWINNRISTPTPSREKNRSLDGTIEYAFYCNQCNKTHNVIVASPFEQLVCPACGNEISYLSHRNCASRSSLFYEADENGLLNVRHIDKTIVLHDDNTLESKTAEIYRIVIAPNAITIYEADENGILRKTKKKISSYTLNNYPGFCQEREEVFAELSKTFLSRYGVDEAHKLGVWDPLSRDGLQFLQTLYEIPQLELFVKCGMSRAAKQLCYGNECLLQDRSAKNICGFLGISKRVFNLSRKNNLGLVEIRLLDQMMKSDPSLTWEVFQQIRSTSCERTAMKVNKDHGISYKKIVDYLKRVDNYQCIPCREAINIWRDYLSMATALKMPLRNKNVKFPTSLKKEHDRAMYAYRTIKVELDLERFHREAEKAQGLSYKGSEYLIRVPKEPEEIVAEGESLHHCVKTYISRIRDGETSIVFLRRVEEPDTPLYTIEVRNDFLTKDVIQIRGLGDRPMKGADMRKFVHEWCDKKGLRYR